MTDIFLYNGPIERGSDLKFIELIATQHVDKICVVMQADDGETHVKKVEEGRTARTRAARNGADSGASVEG